MDYIIRAMAANGQIRAFAATTRDLTETARLAHNTSPIVTAALGRLLTAGAMMGTMLKGKDDALTIRIQCSGPIQGLLVTADANGNVKGYANCPDVMLPPRSDGHLDVSGALGAGILSVIKDMGLKEPYVGDTALQTGEIAEDLTYYFAASEQTPSAVGLGVLMNRENTVRRAGGFLLQLMPSAKEETISALEEKLQGVSSVTQMLDEGKTPENILEELLGDLGLEITQKLPTQFVCNCSAQRFEKGLLCLGKKELSNLLEEGKPIETVCYFCNKKYTFSVEELRRIAEMQHK